MTLKYSSGIINGDHTPLSNGDVLRLNENVAIATVGTVFYNDLFDNDAGDLTPEDIELGRETAYGSTLVVYPASGSKPSISLAASSLLSSAKTRLHGASRQGNYYFPSSTTGNLIYTIESSLNPAPTSIDVGTLKAGETKYFDISLNGIKPEDEFSVTLTPNNDLPAGVKFYPPPQKVLGVNAVRVFITNEYDRHDFRYNKSTLNFPSISQNAVSSSYLEVNGDRFDTTQIIPSEIEGFSVYITNFTSDPGIIPIGARNRLALFSNGSGKDPASFEYQRFSLIHRDYWSNILSKFKTNTVSVDLPSATATANVSHVISSGITGVDAGDLVMANHSCGRISWVFRFINASSNNEFTVSYRAWQSTNPAAIDWNFYSIKKADLKRVTGYGGYATVGTTISGFGITTVTLSTSTNANFTGVNANDFVIHFPPSSIPDLLLPRYTYATTDAVNLNLKSESGSGVTVTNDDWGFLVIPYDGRRYVGTISVQIKASIYSS